MKRSGEQSSPLGSLSNFENVLVVGQSGTGKTYRARELVKDARRLVVYDPAEDPQWCQTARPTTVRELVEHPEILAAPVCRLVVHPQPEDFRDGARARPEEEQRREVEELIRLERAAADLVSVWDEVGDYGDAAAHELSKLARNGRHCGIARVFVSQAAVEIPKRVRRQATRIVSFLQTEPSDLAALAERCGDEFAVRVRGWRRGEPPAVWVLPSLER